MSLSRAVRNTFIQFVGRFFSTIFGIIALAIITRYLGQEKYGWYTTVTTFLQFFGILADFGLTLITAQMIAEPNANEEKIIANIFTLRFWLSVFFFGLATISVWFFPYPITIKLGVMIYSFTLFAVTLQNIFVGLFQKHLAMSKIAWGDILGRFIVLVGFFFCIWRGYSLLPILSVTVVANVFQFALLWVYAKKYIKVHFAYDKIIFKKVLQQSWPVAISIAFNLIYLRADILVLSLVRTQSEVGIYGAAYRVVDVLTSVPTMFMGLMLPMLAYTWVVGDKEKFKKYFSRAFDFLSILGWPLLLGGVALATPIMTLVAGKEFIISGYFLQILLVALFFIFFGLLASHTVLALKKQKTMILWYLFDAILSLVGYIIFIPKYGATAAAWVTVFSEGLIMIISFSLVLRTAKFFPSLAIFLKSFFAALIMMLFVFKIMAYPLILILILAIFVYFITLYLLRGITKQMILSVVKGE